eukprot:TRINITY_DN8652_c0_g1_i1.p1 TRINITY_DN8652_c0_g1~~TRINITY_DN8652_c0_g1_i1.p1  ORF type:complete len:445 (-),score=91.01 TRINITY_DN8652_c0_g1_i1:16-1350(-)
MSKFKRKQTSSKNGTVQKKRKDTFFVDDGDEDTPDERKRLEGLIQNPTISEEEQQRLDEETPEEARLRLAQKFISELGADLEDDEELEEEREGIMAGRILKDATRGQAHRFIADQYSTIGPDDLTIQTLRGHDLSVTCVALSGDDRIACTGSKDTTIIKWDVETGKKLFKFEGRKSKDKEEGHQKQVLSVAISTDGKYLASAGVDLLIRIWDLQSNTHIDSFKGHKDAVGALAFQRDSHQLFSGSHDRTVKLWNIDDMSYVDSLFGHQSEITGLDILHQERAVTSSYDQTVRLWKVVEQTQLVFKGNKSSIDCISMISNDKFMSGSQDGAVTFWSGDKKRPSDNFREAHGNNWVTSVASCKYSDLAASGSSNGYIKLWKAPLAKNSKASEINSFAMEGFVNGMTFNSSGNLLLAAIGQEHKWGRWSKIKTKNALKIIRFPVKLW